LKEEIGEAEGYRLVAGIAEGLGIK